jgi:feruloyl esterase
MGMTFSSKHGCTREPTYPTQQAAGNVGALAGGVGLGYATADSDTGHTYYGHPADVALSSNSWAHFGKGNPNLNALQNFAYRGLEELTLLAKSVTKTYYGKDIEYAYWQGCSTGGRQGLTMVC